jgi:ADP-ribose pyrophosphatase YjhB (NUDIX family)
MPDQPVFPPDSPLRPQIAVSVAIFREIEGRSKFLVVRRANPPAKDLWTLPGGRLEFGETLLEAVTREIIEETTLEIDIVGLAGYREMIMHEHQRHFVILSFAARWRSGEVVLNDELNDFRWIEPADLAGFETTEGLAGIVDNAVRLIRP